MKTMDSAQTQTSSLPVVTQLLKVVGGSLLLAASAQISFNLPFTSIPFSLQVQAVLLLAMLFGRTQAMAAVALYLAEGAMGLPVFAQGGTGLSVLLGMRAGYLIGFLVAAGVVGALFDRSSTVSRGKALLYLLVGNAIVLVLGTAWLAMFTGISTAISVGCAPFLLPDAVKCLALTSLAPFARR